MSHPEFLPLVAQAALHDDYRQVFTVQGRDLLLLMHEGQLHLLENTCPHAGYPLQDGLVVSGALRCPMHGYLFELHSGACIWYTEGPCRGLYRYTTSVQDGQVGVELPLAPQQTGPFQTGKGT
jgi:nitrite reductase/ring-hydroxylating ferredoxin subunit